MSHAVNEAYHSSLLFTQCPVSIGLCGTTGVASWNRANRNELVELGVDCLVAFIQYFARIQTDFGARTLIEVELAGLGVLRPLVISDSGLVGADALDVALSSVVSAKQPRFIEVASNPTEAAKEARDVFLGLAHAGVVAAGTSFNQTAARIGSADDYACIARAAFK